MKGKHSCICGTDQEHAYRDIKQEMISSLTVAHYDPNRKIVLSAIKYIDEIVVYNTEAELYSLLKSIKPNVRILGTDYHGKSFTGDDLDIFIHWHDRYHNWSTTNLKHRIQGVDLI